LKEAQRVGGKRKKGSEGEKGKGVRIKGENGER
jgi:hypothetical protein